MKNNFLSFIAIIPPEPLRKQVTKLKFKFSKSFQTFHALKSPPHITLIPPFFMKETDEKRIIRLLQNFARTVYSFHIAINGFGAFIPRVIYLNIDENEPLRSLQMKIFEQVSSISDLDWRKGRPFSPHMTLAFKDLTPQMFQKAWNMYKSKRFRATFEVNGLSVLKHNGKCWDIRHEIPISTFELPY